MPWDLNHISIAYAVNQLLLQYLYQGTDFVATFCTWHTVSPVLHLPEMSSQCIKVSEHPMITTHNKVTNSSVSTLTLSNCYFSRTCYRLWWRLQLIFFPCTQHSQTHTQLENISTYWLSWWLQITPIQCSSSTDDRTLNFKTEKSNVSPRVSPGFEIDIFK